MTTRLHHYLARLQHTILSRQEIEITEMEIVDHSDQPGQISEFYTRLRFHDDSQLTVVEKLIAERFTIVKARYAYHYQRADGSLVFRYDNVPHHPEIKTHPHHKHIGASIVATQPPDLSEVLREIDAILYTT